MYALIPKNNIGSHTRGDVMEIRLSSIPATAKELEKCIMIIFDDVDDPEDFQSNKTFEYEWELLADFDIISSNTETDFFKLKVFSTLVNSALLGSIEKNDVEHYINNWGGVVTDFGQNAVFFDILIFDAVCSKNFWNYNVSSFVFNEINYNSSTGSHTITVSYPPEISSNYIAKKCNQRGVAIISHSVIAREITIQVTRAQARNIFQEDMIEKFKKQITRRRYYVTNNVVNYVEGEGGTITTDMATFMSYLKDKVLD